MQVLVSPFVTSLLEIFQVTYQRAIFRFLAMQVPSDDPTGALAMGGLSLLTIFLIIGPIILWVWMLVWVNRDAGKYGQSGCMPMLLVLFLGPIGLIIYLLMRPKTA